MTRFVVLGACTDPNGALSPSIGEGLAPNSCAPIHAGTRFKSLSLNTVQSPLGGSTSLAA